MNMENGSTRYGVFAKNSKTGKTYRAFQGFDFTSSEAAKIATNLDMQCRPFLSYFSRELTNSELVINESPHPHSPACSIKAANPQRRRQ